MSEEFEKMELNYQEAINKLELRILDLQQLLLNREQDKLQSEMYSQSAFFRQAFLTRLGSLINLVEPLAFQDDLRVKPQRIVNRAIDYAQEAVRQVGEFNKPDKEYSRCKCCNQRIELEKEVEEQSHDS